MTHKITFNGIDSLLSIMHKLRQPDGCPWDAQQTPESLAPYILEEACELIEVIEAGQTELILDELGDLLLQVVFQAQIFKENGHFDFNDVSTAIAEKLVRRHPHVFASSEKRTEVDLDRQWDEIKRSENKQDKSCLADHLPERLPALQRAQKLIVKAERSDRLGELPLSETEQLPDFSEEDLGKVLFNIVKRANQSGLDAETALRKTIATTVSKMDQNKDGKKP